MDNPFDIIEQRLRSSQHLLHLLHGDNLQVVKSAEVYIKINQTAEFLTATPNAFRVMVSKNQIPYIKKQGKLYFRKQYLVEWFEDGIVSTFDL